MNNSNSNAGYIARVIELHIYFDRARFKTKLLKKLVQILK